ncbi:DUF882 domain-containing protein [Roseibium sp. RKSG952]|uniref:DUF882 domain-containing protein n=1 Tax=Roseibium sp. RKSG952 TaxID=2529384 RepID=UPI0012BC4FE0|nr:DUF882 domain-containing protein [Roseibium sp. RKSG952]MTI00130.1 DUF882 domain-containing protein [Roseibium sp. RKSG952]
MSVAWSLAAKAETRTLKLYNTHTKERVSVTFKKNGRYIPSGLREANRFLRDWRRNEITKIDPELLDLVWEVYQEVRAKDYIYVVSSYRSPATNNMLRKRSSGVAKKSQHTFGRAMDFYIPGVNLAKLRAAGLRKHVGGVGYYPRSGSPFVHMDTGSVRHWPRMSRSQLAKVFPDGKTIHVPTDGKPLKRYQQALAEVKSGKNRSSKPTLVASSNRANRTTDQSLRNASEPIRPNSRDADDDEGGGNFLASLFGSRDEGSERSRVAAVRPNNQRVAAGSLATASASPVIENPPVPTFKATVMTDTPDETPASASDQAPVVVASAAPAFKPSRFADPEIPAQQQKALEAQLVALAQDEPAEEASGSTPAPAGRLDQAVSVPGYKPSRQLLTASLQAAADNAQAGRKIPVPSPAPLTDPVAAIAAATGAAPKQKALPAGATLAYASPASIPAELNARQTLERVPAMAKSPAAPLNPAGPAEASVSGSIPMAEIKDPLAGFASLPDKSESKFLSANATTRNQLFASLQHPDQRSLQGFILPSNRFLEGGFERRPNPELRTDRFEGPAVVLLPVTFAR